MLDKIKNALANPKKIVTYLSSKGVFNFIPDEQYVSIMYKVRMGKKLNLKKPVTLNEKLQWLKINNRKPEYTMMVDKYLVREYISEKLGKEYLIPLIGVWDSPEEINFNELPDKFVLKCNHNSGVGMCICTDKSKLDTKKVKKELKRGIKQDYYKTNREWVYKNVSRKIIAETFMEDEKEKELRDYKFFCFNGYVDCVMLCMDRKSGDTKFYFFDESWNLLRINKRGQAAPEGFTVEKPEGMDEMFKMASKLSQGLPFARIDLYYCNGKIYFGEITFFPDSGYDFNLLPETDLRFGSLIRLEDITND